MIDVQILELDEEEFENVGTYGLENPTKDDFRKFIFDLEMKHSELTTRKIEFSSFGSDLWKRSINEIDNEDRYWFGKGHSQDNDSESYANYYREFVFYVKGLSEEEIINAYNSIYFTIIWETNDGLYEETIYSVGDLIEFMDEQ
ncbi:fructose-bisphosphate aldolase [Chengkuizengella axinellae]|uniref:Fructose-bisphosphate aldolase n=1 Tax=Chengkuizengella axinellae TaxID=3064388 RepID=A0ABT9J6E1_9BACL|nr:fructose-bisphosphate aldolase [Chengkuizengella sp. 2205SS18-9]MDP5277182.1 fructose-bisphosphate aldolase [Chengkuizengella sp. 2205SS18-9]